MPWSVPRPTAPVVARRAVARPVLAALAGAGVVAATLVVPAAAQAATSPHGVVTRAVQDTFTHRVTIRGWAFDSAHRSSALVVSLYADGHYLGKVRTTVASPKLNERHSLSGPHAFVFRTSRTATLRSVTARTTGAHRDGRATTVDSTPVTHVVPPRADRVIAVAKRYVGKARYVEGGASPRTGFDCSGYTKYVFALAKAGTLPHNAQAQRGMRGMRAVSAARARPGDLVFYYSGGSIFHVAIYAGHHRQYAAATPRDGIVYQNIWSSAVSYGRLG